MHVHDLKTFSHISYFNMRYLSFPLVEKCLIGDDGEMSACDAVLVWTSSVVSGISTLSICSHEIINLSFGEEYVGMVNPLDGVSKTSKGGHRKTVVTTSKLLLRLVALTRVGFINSLVQLCNTDSSPRDI